MSNNIAEALAGSGLPAPVEFITASGVKVWFRAWSARDHEVWDDEVGSRLSKDGKMLARYTGLRELLLQRTVCDASGAPVWSVVDPGTEIGKLGPDTVKELYLAARKHHALDEVEASPPKG